MNRRKILKRIILAFGIIFFLMNVLAFIHAWKFTHFVSSDTEKSPKPEHMTVGQKFSTVLFGISNPRPVNKSGPGPGYETISLQSNVKLECWEKTVSEAKGTIILFHGYTGTKSSMLTRAQEFEAMGNNTLLADFQGSGGSEGSKTTLGFYESEGVKTCFDYAQKKFKKNIFLFGTSMGAVAVLKALHDYHLSPSGIMVECPFGSMYKTTCARFHTMGVPTFPMASLLVFWGGVQNGFWGFSHNPSEYAKSVSCPALLIYGKKDPRVSLEETEEIYRHFKGPKKLLAFPEAGHDNFLSTVKETWVAETGNFLRENSK